MSWCAGVGGLLVLFRLWRVVRVMHAVREVQHKSAHDRVHALEQEKTKLQGMADAHHTVVKELHKEFVRRVRACVCVCACVLSGSVVEVAAQSISDWSPCFTSGCTSASHGCFGPGRVLSGSQKQMVKWN